LGKGGERSTDRQSERKWKKGKIGNINGKSKVKRD